MWIFTNKGFLSAVKHFNQPGMLVVRGRVQGHLEAVFPEATVVETTNTDYRFRAVLPAAEVANVIAAQLRTLDYTNFKNSVTDHEYHDDCFKVWSVMHAAQRKDLDRRDRLNRPPRPAPKAGYTEWTDADYRRAVGTRGWNAPSTLSGASSPREARTVGDQRPAFDRLREPETGLERAERVVKRKGKKAKRSEARKAERRRMAKLREEARVPKHLVPDWARDRAPVPHEAPATVTRELSETDRAWFDKHLPTLKRG